MLQGELKKLKHNQIVDESLLSNEKGQNPQGYSNGQKGAIGKGRGSTGYEKGADLESEGARGD
jgi:hypothetical protein